MQPTRSAMQRQIVVQRTAPLRPDAKLTLSQRFAVIRRVQTRKGADSDRRAAVSVSVTASSAPRPGVRVDVPRRSPVKAAGAAERAKGRVGGGMAALDRDARAKTAERRDAANAKSKPSRKTQSRPTAAATTTAPKGKAGPAPKGNAAPKARKPAETLEDAEKMFDKYLKDAGRGQAAAEADVDAELAAYRAAAASK